MNYLVAIYPENPNEALQPVLRDGLLALYQIEALSPDDAYEQGCARFRHEYPDENLDRYVVSTSW